MHISPQALRNDDGFTLPEVLVAMLLSTIILLATLQSLDLFTTNAAQQTRDTDANAQVRRVMDRTVRDLRDASTLLKATASDLVYTVPETGGTRVERLCVAATDLYASSTTSATPVLPTAACAAGTRVANLKSTAKTAFTYDGAASAASLTTVKNVGITLSLDASGGGKTSSSTLQASAARRSSAGLPLTDADIVPICTATGALLNLSADIPGVAGMTVTYNYNGNVSGAVTVAGTAPATLTLPKALTTIVATVTDSLGVTNTLQKDVQCG